MTRLGVEVSKIHAKNKGANAEREVRDIMLRYLLPNGEPVKARRGRQFAGGEDSPDVAHNIKNLHLEVKRQEKFGPAKARDALLQAQRDCGENLPVVVWRQNRTEWVCLLSFTHLLELFGCKLGTQQLEKNENE